MLIRVSLTLSILSKWSFIQASYSFIVLFHDMLSHKSKYQDYALEAQLSLLRVLIS